MANRKVLLLIVECFVRSSAFRKCIARHGLDVLPITREKVRAKAPFCIGGTVTFFLTAQHPSKAPKSFSPGTGRRWVSHHVSATHQSTAGYP